MNIALQSRSACPWTGKKMLHVPGHASAMEVQRVYTKCSYLTVDLARYIRSLGWPARGLPVNSSSQYLHIPYRHCRRSRRTWKAWLTDLQGIRIQFPPHYGCH